MEISIQPIALIYNPRTEPTDDFWGSVTSEIRLLPEIPQEALDGITDFSHLEIIYYFDQLAQAQFSYKSHPRGNINWPSTGIFAQRKKDRPNHLGLTIVELVKKEGKSLFVKNCDALDGTPVLDIKPVMNEFLPAGSIRQPEWSKELMKNYWR